MATPSSSRFVGCRALAGFGVLAVLAGCAGAGAPGGPGPTGGTSIQTGGASAQTGGAGAGGASAQTGGASAQTGGAGAGGVPSSATGGLGAVGGATGGTPANGGGASADGPAADAPMADVRIDPAGAVVWAIDNLTSIGGHPTMVLGAPLVIDTPEGKALQFDGVDDALFVDHQPLAGWPAFTVELYFRPDPGGVPAQRFFHMQDDSSGGRVLFETRLPGNNTWVLDVFLESAAGEVALYAPRFTHPLGAWYHLAAVVEGKRATAYVNGMPEMTAAVGWGALKAGRTSIGVRITRMYFFKGAIRLARFTPRVLAPAEFLPPPR